MKFESCVVYLDGEPLAEAHEVQIEIKKSHEVQEIENKEMILEGTGVITGKKALRLMRRLIMGKKHPENKPEKQPYAPEYRRHCPKWAKNRKKKG